MAGVKPLVNVLDYYGGNSQKMRITEDDFKLPEKVDIQQEIKKLNKNMQGNLVKTPKPFEREWDEGETHFNIIINR